ncbi:MAG: ATP-binding protein [Gordonibacter sp.]|uniref:AAA family ATPase n=1 Tax=Gordonibacter sp. TaxID=1968902 RepID=UPI002FC732E8
MLIEFTFDNFKCYRDEVTLQMEAASIDEHDDTLINGVGSRCILPVSVIYGPNGGGKSSVLQALECLYDYVTLPYFVLRQRIKNFPKITCRPYAFEAESRSNPTTFCVLFDRGEYLYRYILSVKEGRIEEEYLHRRKAGKGATATIFERSGKDVELGSSLKRKRVNTDVDEMMPYLTFLKVNYDFDSVDDAFGWFLSCEFLDYSESRFENFFMEPKEDFEKQRIIGLLNAMDINITDIRYEHGKEDTLEGIYLTHNVGDGYELELDEESNGTRKLLSLVPPILVALAHGHLLVSDELDAKLHPKLLKYLIRLFADKKTNPKGAQLVITSHDMSTLNSSMFRRDEIWFAARTPDGPSQLYSLADIADSDGKRVRTGNAYDRQYLAGRYGADPYLQNMLTWDEAKDAGDAHE